MKKVVNFLRGSVEVEAPGRLSGAISQPVRPAGGVLLGAWNGWRVPRCASRCPRRSGAAWKIWRCGPDARSLRCETGGLPTFLERFRRRYPLLAGFPALSLLAVLLMTQFVLVVDVAGNTEVPSAAILSTLRRLGVRPGAFGPALEINYIEQRALLELEGLSWMSITSTEPGPRCSCGSGSRPPSWWTGPSREISSPRPTASSPAWRSSPERPSARWGSRWLRGTCSSGETCCWRGPCTANRTWAGRRPGPGTGGGPDLAHPSGIHSPHGPGQGVHRAGDRAVVSHRFGKTHQFLSKQWNFLSAV